MISAGTMETAGTRSPPDRAYPGPVDAVSHHRHCGGMMRQGVRPWEALGISRATWYRHGKPTKKRRKPKTVAEVAAQVGASSTRTYYRTMRVLGSEQLAAFVHSGQLSMTQADRLLGGDPKYLRRFLELVAAHQKPAKH